MDAKEKAKELVQLFYNNQCSYSIIELAYNSAKQCALICLNQMKDDALLYGDVNAEDWLNKVKEEIINHNKNDGINNTIK